MKNRSVRMDIVIAIASLIFVGLVSYGTYYLITKEKTTTTEKVNVVKSEDGANSPQEAVASFIYTSGNIWKEENLTSEQLMNGTARSNMINDRENTYIEASKYVVSDSPVKAITLNEAKDYAKNMRNVEVYTIPEDSIRVSKDIEDFSDTTLTGSEINGVVVNASFDSFAYRYRQKVTDSSSDGTYVREVSEKKYKDIPFYVAEVGDNKWKVFDIDDNGELGYRLILWNPATVNSQSDDEYTVDKEYKGSMKVNEIVN